MAETPPRDPFPTDAKPPTADKPPAEKKGPGGRREGAGRPKVNITEEIESFVGFVGAGLLIVDRPCASAVLESAHAIGVAGNDLAKQNPKVRKTLERVFAVGAWGKLATAASPLIFTVLAHHGILPRPTAELLGVRLEENEWPMRRRRVVETPNVDDDDLDDVERPVYGASVVAG